ncbi:unnamed protein product, partial [Ectocarpus sp. 4 AP-2014]
MAIDALERSRRSSGQQIGENSSPAAAEGGNEKDGVGVGGSNASVPFEIREYSDSASDDENNDTAEAKESAETRLHENKEESGDDDRHQTASDQEHEMDMAQQKKNRRARAQPGAKRGGRRDTGKGGWFQLLGRKKTQFEPGDLVEAEWAGTGWWYVGYIGFGSEERGEESTGGTAGAPQAKTSKRRKELFHVVFEDGDEADVSRRDLKRLQPTG